MERILTTAQMRLADKFTLENLGVDEQALIERAGQAIVDEILKRFKGGRVLVCVGKGNNGKDGLVVANLLSVKHGFSVSVINVANGFFKLFERKYDIIIDCIFGTGLNREVDGKYKKAIDLINQSDAYIISCDIPSGLNGDTGIAMGAVVKADLTIAIQEYKLGHFLNDGIDFCGEIISKDIGISIWSDNFVKRINRETLSLYFKTRPRNSHKGSYGKCAIIGGSKNFSGSILLSTYALSAFKMGVGYVNVIVPKSMMKEYVGKVPECILTPITDLDGQICFDEKILKSILSHDCIAVGMGMGTSKETYYVVKYLVENYAGKLIIDADGLNSLARYGADILASAKGKIVLTPHIGEFARLSCIDKEKILINQIDFTRDYARQNGVTIILKNAVSVISDGDEVFINTSGCVGMAKAGSGDVLSGVIAGLLARSHDSTVCETVAAASYYFGLCGERARDSQNDFTITSSDIIAAMPNVINDLN